MLIKGEDGVLFCQKLLRAVLDINMVMVVDFFPGALCKKKATRLLDTARMYVSRSEYHRTCTWYPGTGRVHDFSEHRMVQVKQKTYYTWTVGHVDVYYTAVYLYTFDLCPFVLFVWTRYTINRACVPSWKAHISTVLYSYYSPQCTLTSTPFDTHRNRRCHNLLS